MCEMSKIYEKFPKECKLIDTERDWITYIDRRKLPNFIKPKLHKCSPIGIWYAIWLDL